MKSSQELDRNLRSQDDLVGHIADEARSLARAVNDKREIMKSAAEVMELAARRSAIGEAIGEARACS